MHILITDSGVGGLSVCAYLERHLRRHGGAAPVRLTFVNASPSNESGYNAMGSRQEKLDYFDRFLHRVTDRYAPDFVYVACNTLSVLLPDTTFARAGAAPVRGIVDTGGQILLRELERQPDARAVVFATATTIAEQAYPRLLLAHGIEVSRIIAQACPNLADVISEDRDGEAAQQRIDHFVGAALEQSAAHLPGGEPIYLAYMGCTHYGYRKAMFEAAFARMGARASVLDPNELVLGDLLPPHWCAAGAAPARVDVEFVTRYRIPQAALETIGYFLNPISPATVAAFTRYTFAPELF